MRRLELLSLARQRGERVQLLGRFVHAHQGHQGAALALREARALFGAGAFGQFGADEYHQQALRLGLGARGAQQVVKVLDLHG